MTALVSRFFKILLVLFVVEILIFVPSAYTAQNGPNNNDSQPVLDLTKFTDVPALFAAVRKAKADAAALPKSGADRPHIEKAIASLNAALSDSFTASNIDNLFQNVRQAVQSLETVKGSKVAAQKIAGDLTEAIRAADEKFLTNVERAIPRLTDTKTRENASKDLAKSRDDYGRGVSAISTNRTAAINHFQQAMKRMVGYPLTLPIQKPIVATDTELIFIDASGNVIKRLFLAPDEGASVSPNGLFASVLKRDQAEESFLVRLIDTGGNEIASTLTVPFWDVFVSDSGNIALVGGWDIDGFSKGIRLYAGAGLQELSLGDNFGIHLLTVWGSGDKFLIYNDENRRKIEEPSPHLAMDAVLYYFDIPSARLIWSRTNVNVGPATFDVAPHIEGSYACARSISYVQGAPQPVIQCFDLATGVILSERLGWN